MKIRKILLSVVLILLSGSLYAQHPIGTDSFQLQTLGSTAKLVKSNGAIAADSGFINSAYVDTVAANKGHLKNYPGAQIRMGDSIWMRNKTATRWLLLTGGGSGTPQGLQDVIDVNNQLNRNDSIIYNAHTLTLYGGPTIVNTTTTTPLTVTSGVNGISVTSTLAGGTNNSITTNGRITGASIFSYDQTYGVKGSMGVGNFYATPGAVTAGVWGAAYQHHDVTATMAGKILAGVYADVTSYDAQPIGNGETVAAVYGVSAYFGDHDTTYGVVGTAALAGTGTNHTFYSLRSKRFSVTNMDEMGGLLLDSVADNGVVHPYGINQKGNNNVNIFNATTNYFPNLPTYSSGGNSTVVWNSSTHRIELTSGSGGTGINASDTAAMLLPYLRKIDTTAMLSPYLRSNVAAATYQPLDADLTTWAGITPAANVGTFLATPSSANLRSALTDESGTGAAYFQGGDAGTPSALVLTNATGLPVAGGGTGVASTTAYGVLAGGTTSTGAFQNIGVGTSGYYLVSNGAGALATWQDKRPISASVSGSNVTTTLATAGDITGLSIAVGANKKYRLTGELFIGCDNTGGVKFAINGPSGSAILVGSFIGSNTSANAVIGRRCNTLGALTGASFNNFNGGTGFVKFTVYFTTSSTTGSVTVQFASTNAGETSTVFTGSTCDLVEVQ